LLTVGEWLDKYGEAIYETRPWYTFGEGPTKEPEGHFRNASEFLKIKYSAKDVRYTTKDNVIYATVLGWPGENTQILLESFSRVEWKNVSEIKDVSMLGCQEKIEYQLTDNGLKIKTPIESTDEIAIVFKIELE